MAEYTHDETDKLHLSDGLTGRALVERHCPRGHGLLKEEPGFWCVVGVDRNPVPPEERGFNGADHRSDPNGTAWALQMFRCLTCGFVELVDPE